MSMPSINVVLEVFILDLNVGLALNNCKFLCTNVKILDLNVLVAKVCFDQSEKILW